MHRARVQIDAAVTLVGVDVKSQLRTPPSSVASA
jgi:hypothetical protein